MATQLNVRVDDKIRQGIEAYRVRYKDDYELRELSDAVRHILKKALRAEGLLSEKEGAG
jgi:hypothetical protein